MKKNHARRLVTKLIILIFFLTVGTGLTTIGITNFVNSLDDCISCSVLDDQCPESCYIKGNTQCVDELWFAMAFFAGISVCGISLLIIGISLLIFGDDKNKKYHCSIHGGNGDLSCDECWNNLKQLCGDNNAYLCGDIK